MNFLPLLTTWQFAVAGAVFAAGPVIIHLLNRRRYRTVSWAAMDFLREAMQRNRKIMQLRDIVLLVVRTIAVLLLGLALAQPYLAANRQQFDGRSRLHAVLLVDNSLSMGYQSLSGTLLDRAKQRATEYVQQLPPGSLISVIPLCGARQGYSPDPFSSKQQALESLEAIQPVDVQMSLTHAVNEARKACAAAPDLAKRIVLLSDQQRANWRNVAAGEALQSLPSLQVVDITGSSRENAWVADLRLQDGLADVETPTTIIVGLRYLGSQASREVELALNVGGRPVATRSIRLDPGQGVREVTFQHVFDQYAVEPGKAAFVPVTASITPDALPDDDQRQLVVPVVATLPVVFVDQFGADQEDVLQGRLGETRHLRRLLAPVTNRQLAQRQLVQIRHVRLDELTRDLLADTRLVVIAGVSDPESAVPLLREYLLQGGQLVIAAGAEFDPAAWNRAAWLNGRGILPAPLQPDLLGHLPEQAGADLKPFSLLFDSMKVDEDFQLAGNAEQELKDLYEEPLFFQAAGVDMSRETLDALLIAERTRIEEELLLWQEVARQRAEMTGGPAGAAKGANAGEPTDADPDLDRRWQALRPAWLLWQTADLTEPPELPDDADQRRRLLDPLARGGLPHVLARFAREGQPAFIVERQIGKGNVMFVSSGLLSSWNTLPMTNAFVLFDRILRRRIRATLPVLNFATAPRIAVPVPRDDRGVVLRLQRPGAGEEAEYLDVGFLGPQQRGVVIESPYDRGLYRLWMSEAAGDTADAPPLWETTLAVAGDPEESDLTPMTRDELSEQVASENVRWVADGETISLAGAQVRGQHFWRFLIGAVLLLLLAEILVLGWSSRRAAVVAGSAS
jgi:hypothetical protein